MKLPVHEIVIGNPERNLVPILELDRKLVPTGRKDWVNVFIPFRKIDRRNGKHSPLKLTLRKYRYNQKTLKWNRIQAFNVNNKREARAILLLIRAYFPEVDF